MMEDAQYMSIAIEEAKKGLGRTSPNPAVGAVIVKSGRIISKGYHKKAGTAHAEIHAINNAIENLKGSTIYVTLEPCSHTGKTPPCCEAIARAGISRVVVGMTDPNPLVNGRGISFLMEEGVEVLSGILEKECEDINLPFIKYIKTSLPFMVMKAGVSLDGRLNYQDGLPGRITGAESGEKVHHLRNRFDAIMVGSSTIIADNPSLTARLNNSVKRDPVRIILDTNLRTSLLAKVYTQDSEAKTIVICCKGADQMKVASFRDQGINVVAVDKCESGVNLDHALLEIADLGISSVLVEGGAKVHGSLLLNKMYDFAYLFYAPVFAGDFGKSLVTGMEVGGRDLAPRISAPQYEKCGEDMLVSGKIVYPVNG